MRVQLRPGPGGFEPPRPGGGRALRRALTYLRRYRRDTTGALLALLVVSAANLGAPQFIRYAVDVGLGEARPDAVAIGAGGLVAVAALRGLFAFLQGFLAERASQGVAYDLRDALFAHIQRLSFSYHDRVETGQLLTRVTNDVDQVRTFVGMGVVQLAAAAAMLVGSVALLVSINWRLALVALATIPPIFVLLIGFARRVGPLFGRVQQALGRLNAVLQEDLAGIRVIRAFGREPFEAARYRAANQALLEQNVSAVRALAGNFPKVFFFANLGTLAVVWFGGLEILDGRLTVGELIAFNTYLGFLLMPIFTIGFLTAAIARAGASALRIFEVLDAPLDVHDAPGAVPLPPIVGRVTFEDVCFRYPGTDRDILSGVSFTVEPGRTVAILGTTGSGKSTVTNLLPRFYDVTGGRVAVDGHDVRSVTLASLRRQIGIVLQETLLFSGTLHDNIAYGKSDATRAEVEAAARAAQADAFIRALPEGYDTVVGERGVGLSGGQRQRIAIARALLIQPRLLVLDDSTSAVDAQTEAAILAALDRLMRDRRLTVFVIAQRISTVRDADLILVLDEGRVVAQGTHEALLAGSDLYNDILGSQVRAEGAPDGVTAPAGVGAAP